MKLLIEVSQKNINDGKAVNCAYWAIVKALSKSFDSIIKIGPTAIFIVKVTSYLNLPKNVQDFLLLPNPFESEIKPFTFELLIPKRKEKRLAVYFTPEVKIIE